MLLALLLLGVIPKPVDAAGKCDGYISMIAEGGIMWASLGNADPKSTNVNAPTPYCSGCTKGCENQFMAIRGTGWIISPDNAASIAICKKFGFGTYLLTMSNGCSSPSA